MIDQDEALLFNPSTFIADLLLQLLQEVPGDPFVFNRQWVDEFRVVRMHNLQSIVASVGDAIDANHLFNILHASVRDD